LALTTNDEWPRKPRNSARIWASSMLLGHVDRGSFSRKCGQNVGKFGCSASSCVVARRASTKVTSVPGANDGSSESVACLLRSMRRPAKYPPPSSGPRLVVIDGDRTAREEEQFVRASPPAVVDGPHRHGWVPLVNWEIRGILRIWRLSNRQRGARVEDSADFLRTGPDTSADGRPRCHVEL